MRLKSRTSLWMRSISAEWMMRPSKDARLVAGFFLGHCGWSCAGCGNGPLCSNTWPRSRQSIQPRQAGQRMKCSASLLVELPRRFPRYLPRGTPIMGATSQSATPQPSCPQSSRLFNMSPHRLRAVIFLLLVSTPWR